MGVTRASSEAYVSHVLRRRLTIDFIYLHGKVKPVHCRMITEGVNGILPSDHYFVMADVKVGD